MSSRRSSASACRNVSIYSRRNYRQRNAMRNAQTQIGQIQWEPQTIRRSWRYAHQRTLRMTIPGLVLALQMSGQHDEELAIRLQRRDPEAMTDLYCRFGRLGWAVIVASVRDASVAEDLVQETFLRVWNRVHAFEAG